MTETGPTIGELEYFTQSGGLFQTKWDLNDVFTVELHDNDSVLPYVGAVRVASPVVGSLLDLTPSDEKRYLVLFRTESSDAESCITFTQQRNQQVIAHYPANPSAGVIRELLVMLSQPDNRAHLHSEPNPSI